VSDILIKNEDVIAGAFRGHGEVLRALLGDGPIPDMASDDLGFYLGAGDRSRTRDILITSEALYQLSYTGASPALVRDCARNGTRNDVMAARRPAGSRLWAAWCSFGVP